ncbi:BTAD domain-containing putative transcriptional regulator [Streptomyces sp. NPDC048718]|uniref:AfsR/SARP family transcriptional regulator n=1 Tax=Streptomyces sp. NPDC048718 TaxID=3365587 RepID=UPI003724BF8F
MDVRILGGLSVRENGVSVTPAAAAPRQVLALLATFAGRLVPASVLTEELWPGGAPRRARYELQAHITGLRSLIAAALPQDRGAADGRSAETVLAAEPGGYRLDTGSGSHDVGQFSRAAGAGYRAMEAGDLPRAALRLGEALALWRGEPYAGVAAGPRLRTEAERLEASRFSVLDQWAEAHLGLGRHAELLPELALHTARYPLNEPLNAQFIVALLRSGRVEDALEAHRRLCALLQRDGGREPSARLRRLHDLLLAARHTPLRKIPTQQRALRPARRPAAQLPAPAFPAFPVSAASSGALVPLARTAEPAQVPLRETMSTSVSISVSTTMSPSVPESVTAAVPNVPAVAGTRARTGRPPRTSGRRNAHQGWRHQAEAAQRGAAGER